MHLFLETVNWKLETPKIGNTFFSGYWLLVTDN